MSDPKTVLTAVVHNVRAELTLINPDFRSVGRMIADGLEALAEHVPEPPEVRAAEPPEVRTRKKRG